MPKRKPANPKRKTKRSVVDDIHMIPTGKYEKTHYIRAECWCEPRVVERTDNGGNVYQHARIQ